MTNEITRARQNNFYKTCQTPEKKTNRKHYKHSENETSSIEDPVFNKSRQKQKGPLAGNVPKVSNDNKNIILSRDSIETHIDKRVSSFFEQLIVCYKVPYHFSSFNGSSCRKLHCW